MVVAVCALAATGCTAGGGSGAATTTQPTTPPPATSVSPTPPASTPPAPDGTGRVNLYAEVAYHFGMPTEKVEDALTAARVEMVRLGGPSGQALHGEDEHPRPLDQGAHLDPRIVAFFAARLGVPEATGREVMEGLMDEWNEYDEQADENNPGAYDRMATRLAERLHVSRARALWFEMLLISRVGRRAAGSGPDAVERALTAAAGVTAAQFGYALEK